MAEVALGLMPVISLTAMLFGLGGKQDEWSEILQDTNRRRADPVPHFFHVVEIPWDAAEGSSKVLVDLPNKPWSEHEKAFPVQKARSFRVYVFEGMEMGGKVFKGFEGLALEAYPEGVPSASSAFSHLESQWSAERNCGFWQFRSYQVKALSDTMLKIRRAIEFTACMLRVTKNIYVHQNQDGGIAIFIQTECSRLNLASVYHSNDEARKVAFRRPSHEDVIHHLRMFCSVLSRQLASNQMRDLVSADVRMEVRIQLALLTICSYSIDQSAGFTDDIERYYLQIRAQDTDPRRTIMTKALFDDMLRDAWLYGQLDIDVANLTSSASSSLDLLSLRLGPQHDFKFTAGRSILACADLKRRAAGLCTRLDTQFRLMESVRGFHESINVRLLGILASIFLPLSLAAGLLSMQTRLVDLHYLLYDFCGVLVVLGTVVFLLVVLIRGVTRVTDQLNTMKTTTGIRRYIYMVLRLSIWLLGLASWGLLLSSFLVGMIKSVSLGLRILGYGAAALGGILALITGGVFGLRLLLF